MSTIEQSASGPPNAPPSLTSANIDRHPSPFAQAQSIAQAPRVPNLTSTHNSEISGPDQVNSTGSNAGQMTATGSNEGGRNARLGMDMPLPPVPPPSSAHVQHAQSAPLQHSSPVVTQPLSVSPLSFTSSGAPFPAPYVPPAALQRPSSPSLPLPPVLSRPGQETARRSNTGISGRSLSFVEARSPSRSASTSARTNNESGPGYNNGNGSRNVCRNSERQTMSSITTSMEKAGMTLEQDNPRVYHVDLGYGDRFRDSRYHDIDNRSQLPAPIPAQEHLSMRDIMQVNAGGGGDGNGRLGATTSPDRSSDSIGIPRFPRTVQERLQPTINHAMAEEAKYARKARITGYALNCAIGLQVLLSALITALSAVTSGRRTQIMTSILGGAGTIVASYLARARGSNEPELSITRTKDLQRFVRTCDAFVQDHGRETGFEDSNGEEGKEGGFQDLRRAKELDDRIREFRSELEHLLGYGDGERRLSPPV